MTPKEKRVRRILQAMIDVGDLSVKTFDGKEYFSPTEKFIKQNKEMREKCKDIWIRLAKVGFLWRLMHKTGTPKEFEAFVLSYKYCTIKELDRLIAVEKEKGHRVEGEPSCC